MIIQPFRNIGLLIVRFSDMEGRRPDYPFQPFLVFVILNLLTLCSFQSFFFLPESHAGKIHRMLILDSQSGEPYETARKATLQQLAVYGYVNNMNLFITYYSLGNDKDKGIDILKKELSTIYDIVFLNGTMAAIAAKNVVELFPHQSFVFVCVTDPVGLGLIRDFETPPLRRFTGVCYPVPVRSRLNFIRDIMPEAKTAGLIYADMPQSRSYRKWIEDYLNRHLQYTEFSIDFRTVPLITGEDGSRLMAENAKPYVLELDSKVNVFISPNDQMGVKRPFADMVYRTASKPLVGLGVKDVMEGWGATMSIYPSQESAGRQCARMIRDIFQGGNIETITPEWPKENGFAFDLRKAKRFGIKIPIEMIELAGDNIVY